MNPRIRELAEQAGGCIYTDNGEPFGAHFNEYETFEKFAELIVEECCDVLQNEDIRYGGYGYNQGFLHKKIKEHFGVEQ